MMTRSVIFISTFASLAGTGAALQFVEENDGVRPFVVDDTEGLGLRFEGIGAISGGGATSKLLFDYPKDVQSDVLDYMFKPGMGLDLQMLKVEIGGNTDATEGAEPSHMHGDGEENYNRGYEWWLMKEAKKRNPDIKLYGLPWGWSGVLDPEAKSDKSADPDRALAQAESSADYTVKWVLGAKRHHNLTIDYVGLWNERDPPQAYIEALHKAVEKSDAKGSTMVLDRLRHYPGATNTPDSQGCQQFQDQDSGAKPGRNWVDEEGSIFDGRSARCLARVLNRNYISMCKTATIQWHLISSFYDYLPWARCGVAVANEPWSGAYEITSPTWAIAHTTQFNPIGWKFAKHGKGVHMLQWGGSMVARISPDKQDFSIVIEKMDPKTSACAQRSAGSVSSPACRVAGAAGETAELTDSGKVEDLRAPSVVDDHEPHQVERAWTSVAQTAARALWRHVTSLCGGRRVPTSEACLYPGPPTLPPRRSATTQSVDLACAAATYSEEQEAVGDHLWTQVFAEVQSALATAVKSTQAQAVRLRQQLRDPAEAESLREWGRALAAAPETAEPEAGCLECHVSAADGSQKVLMVRLPQPSKSLAENASACFTAADKIDITNLRCEPLAAKAEADANDWAAKVPFVEGLQNAGDVDAEAEAAVRRLHTELRDAGFIRERAPVLTQSPEERLRRKYGKGIDCFLSPSGHEVIAGRTAATNEKVSFALTPKDAFWFHSDCGVPGSHVAILCPASEVASLEDVEFAAALAAWHSKARGQHTAAVCYCYGGQIARPRVPKLGQVRILGRRGQIHVSPALPDDGSGQAVDGG